MKKKRWFTETRYADIETGEVLNKARVERERYVFKNKEESHKDCGAYMLKIILKLYESNKQIRLFE